MAARASRKKAASNSPSPEEMTKYYEDMLLIRRFEEKAGQLYGMGLIGGFCHLYIGQEAVVVGLQASCREGEDQVVTSYRDHGHMLACGMDAGGVMAELTGREVVQAIYPDLTPKEGKKVDTNKAVIGLSPNQSFQRAACCQPLPGERIVGITFRGEGVVVHAIDCARMVEYDEQPERWLDLHWHDGAHPAVYGTTLDLTIGNDAGVLGRICTLIGESEANISNLEFLDRKPDFYRLLIYVELRDATHLHTLMSALEAESDVAAIARYRQPVAPDGAASRRAAE